jgi:hypothetical protein
MPLISKLNTLIIVALLLAGTYCQATQVAPRDLEKLVAESDFIFHGTVTKVDMLNGNGEEITDLESSTGPGIPNSLRLHIKVDKEKILYSSIDKIPDVIIVPLWKRWHNRLKYAKADESKKYVFLLKKQDKGLTWVYPAGWKRKLDEVSEIKRFINRPE